MAGEEHKADILILSSAIGSGHMRASAAVVRGVALLDSERTCSIVDFPHEVSPAVEHLLRSAYLESLKLWPAAYGRIYRSSESKSQPSSYRHYVERVGLKTLERLVASTGARALVAPHFYGAGVLGSYKERNPRAFAAVVLTDYVPNAIGVPPNLNLYVVADEEAAELVVKFGVPEEKIYPTGIPIDPAFDEDPADPGGVRRDLLKLEDDELPVVLVMGGGLGGGDLERAVSLLFEVSAAMHLVVLCGSNERSRERLEKLAAKEGYSATFLAFTDRVRDLMAGATALVTKPGGMSCTEALAAGLPQVLYHPIPGQEEDNAAAMARYGAGVVVKTTDEILGETLRIYNQSGPPTLDGPIGLFRPSPALRQSRCRADPRWVVVRHPRTHTWETIAGIAAAGAALAGLRTAAGRPVRSAPTLAAAGAGMAAGGLMVYEWLTPRSWLYGPVFWHARTQERVVALTFDDGPCHPHTEQLLEILDREGVRSTFFQVGNNVRREPNLAAEVASQHVVANHTHDHPHLLWSRPGTIREQLQRGQEAIHDATGTLPHLFRVPHGWYGPQVISTAEELDFRCVGWSVMAWDWNRPPSDVIECRILHGLRPGGISLLHDGQDTDAFPKADRSHTIAAVPHIIRILKASGYGFLTLPELMDLDARDDRP